MSSIYFSEFYEISVTREDDWFDPRMVLDTELCIDPFLVFKADHSYFKDTKQKFLKFFETAYSLASDPSNHSLLIEHTLPIGEVAELCLGFSKTGIRGGGRDKKFAKNVVQTLIDLRKNSRFTSELFKAIEIFTPGIGKDKISDAMANIIKRDLIEYTLTVCEKHPQIRTKCFPIANVEFDYETGFWDDQFFQLPVNPYESKPTAIILVPKRFLRTVQSVSSDELGNYLAGKPNEELRALLNNIIRKNFKDDDGKALDRFRDKLKNKKTILVDLITRSPELLADFLNYVEDPKNEDYFTSYDFEQDPDGLYVLPKAVYEFTSKNPLKLKATNKDDVIRCIEKVITQFREFIERHDGYKLFWMEKPNSSSGTIRHRNESILQNVFRYFVYSYCNNNEVKIETSISHLGEKSVEFIFSNGCRSKILIKLKLFANIRFEKDDLKDLLDSLKQSSISSFYYLAFLYYKSEFEQISERFKEIESVATDEICFKPVVINASLDRSATLSLPSEFMLEEKEVCISYKRGGFSEEIVDKLCEILKVEGIKIVRDDELKYKDSLKEFMARLGRGKCVVTVISDGYLRSRYCMGELLRMSRSGSLIDRIVPIVLEDAKEMYDPIQAFDYLEHWKKQGEEFNARLKNFMSADTKGMREDGDDLADIERNFSQIITFLRDINVKQVKAGIEPDFTEVLGEIKEILSKRL